jgi:subtilisin-like proprotein convertase family protein
MKNVLSILFIAIVALSYSQTQEEKSKILANYDLEYLNQLSEDFSENYYREKAKAYAYAKANGIDTIIRYENGGLAMLQQVLEDGTLLYLGTDNADSAVTINTENVYNGGDRGLSLDGTNIVLGIWDGGIVRPTHQELNGRVVQIDNPPSLDNHATHVAGTMIASGVNSAAKGMAHKARLRAYSFFVGSDLAGMTNEASQGMLMSNHSYGLIASQLPDNFFGAYVSNSRNIDILTYNAPYYLPVFSAGNDRNNNPPYNPLKNGFDLINGKKIAKNNLCVANVLAVSNYVDASSVLLSNSSSFGPADDGRIKPDIASQGTSVFSSLSDSDTSYGNLSGTSMAAPAVTGSLALLQEHHNNMFGSYLTSASMKALVLHTAREAGSFPGPDYRFGWGLMDTAAAADMITNNGFTTKFEENTLNQGDTYTFTVEALDPSVPLVATIAWTDPAGQIQDTSTADDPTPRLVNDLDIRVFDENGTEFFPWKLNPSQPSAAATKGDNIVDNIEKIEIDNPSSIYTIEVTHKGTLQDSAQNYSIVVSGVRLGSDIHVFTDKQAESYCQSDAAAFNIIVNSVPSFAGDINLTQSGLPAGVLPAFFPSTVTDSGSTTLFVTNLSAVAAGEYPFTVTATSGSETSSFDLILKLNASTLANPTLVGPSNGSTDVAFNPILSWDHVNSADMYDIEISDDSTFSNIIQASQVFTNEFKVDELNADSTYFWRVKPINNCVEGAFSTSSSFTTKTTTCSPLFTTTNTPLSISDGDGAIQQSIITIPSSFSGNAIDDINVHLDITHSSMGDLAVSITSPSGTTVSLLQLQCGFFDNASVIFDDKGTTPSCSSSPPTLDGVFKGKGKLSDFEGEDFVGDWILTVEDVSANGEVGSLDNFEIEVCYSQTLSTASNNLSLFSLYPNPASGTVNLNLVNPVDNQHVEIYDINGRLVSEIELNNNSKNHQLDINTLNNGIYLVKVIQGNQSHTEKLIVR